MKLPFLIFVALTACNIYGKVLSTSLPLYYGLADAGTVLKCDPLATDSFVKNGNAIYEWKVPRHLKNEAQISFLQSGDKLIIPEAQVKYSGVYQCDLFVNGLPQATVEQELVVGVKTRPDIYNSRQMQFPDKQCSAAGKETYKRIHLDMTHVFQSTDSMLSFFRYSLFDCYTDKKVVFLMQPEPPHTAIMEGRSSPKALMQECTNTLQKVFDSGKRRLITYLEDGEGMSSAAAKRIVAQLPTEITVEDKNERSKQVCRVGTYMDGDMFVCLPCRPGFRYEKDKKKCTPCLESTYQDKYGERECKPCKNGVVNKQKTACLKDEGDKVAPNINLEELAVTTYTLKGYDTTLYCNPNPAEKNSLPHWKKLQWHVPTRVADDIVATDDKITIKDADSKHSGRYTCELQTEPKRIFVQELLVLQLPRKTLIPDMKMEFHSDICKEGNSTNVRTQLEEFVCPKMQGGECQVKFKDELCEKKLGIYKGGMVPIVPPETVFENCLTNRCVLEKVLRTMQDGVDASLPVIVEYLKQSPYYNSKPMQGAEEIDYEVKKKWYKYVLGGQTLWQTCAGGHAYGFIAQICVPCTPGFKSSSLSCKPCSKGMFSYYGEYICQRCIEKVEEGEICPELKEWLADQKTVESINTHPSVAGQTGAQDINNYRDGAIDGMGTNGKAIGIGVGVGVAVLIVLICICKAKSKKKAKPEAGPEGNAPNTESPAPQQAPRRKKKKSYTKVYNYDQQEGFGQQDMYGPQYYGGMQPDYYQGYPQAGTSY